MVRYSKTNCNQCLNAQSSVQINIYALCSMSGGGGGRVEARLVLKLLLIF